MTSNDDAQRRVWQAIADATPDAQLEDLAEVIDTVGTPMFTIVVGTHGTAASLSSFMGHKLDTMSMLDVAIEMGYVLEAVGKIHANLTTKVAAAALAASMDPEGKNA